MPLRLALPLQLNADGTLATLEQGSPAEIAQSVALLLSTRPGERRSVEDYGTEDPLFSGLSIEDVNAAVETWEERAAPATVELVAAGLSEYAEVHPSDSDSEVYA